MKYLAPFFIVILLGLAPNLVAGQSTNTPKQPACSITADTEIRVLKAVAPICCIDFVDLYSMYLTGACAVEFVEKDGAGYHFRVELGGGFTTIVIITTF